MMTVYAAGGKPEKAIPLLNKCLEHFSIYDEWIHGNPDLWGAIQGVDYSDWLDHAITKEGMTYEEWKQRRE